MKSHDIHNIVLTLPTQKVLCFHILPTCDAPPDGNTYVLPRWRSGFVKSCSRLLLVSSPSLFPLSVTSWFLLTYQTRIPRNYYSRHTVCTHQFSRGTNAEMLNYTRTKIIPAYQISGRRGLCRPFICSPRNDLQYAAVKIL
jgi:hypothetical protein